MTFFDEISKNLTGYGKEANDYIYHRFVRG